jgi:hypothetical protein
MTAYYPPRARSPGRGRAPPGRPRLPALEPEPRPGALEAVADDISVWLEDTAEAVAGAMTDGATSPFTAQASQAELAAYYGSTLWSPQGVPDQAEWAETYARVGWDGLREAVDGGAAWRRDQGLPVTLPPPTVWARGPGQAIPAGTAAPGALQE